MHRNWAHLPTDLLATIANKSQSVEDIFAFSAVCTSWNSASCTAKNTWTPPAPYLIIPNIGNPNPSPSTQPLLTTLPHSPCDQWTFYQPSTNTHIDTDLRKVHNWSYRPCGNGWLFGTGFFPQVALLNPLTNTKIFLPNYRNLPPFTMSRRAGEIQSVAMVKIPPNDEFLVFVVKDMNGLAVAKPGDEAWNYIQCFDKENPGEPFPIEDVIVFQGQILILYGDGQLVSSTIDNFLANPTATAFKQVVPAPTDGTMSVYVDALIGNMLLVELGGELVLVLRYRRSYVGGGTGVVDDNSRRDADPRHEFVFATKWFEVFKYDSVNGIWEDLDEIGDVSLFVSGHTCISVCASSAKTRPNCIYFTEDKDFWKWRWEVVRGAVGMFSLRSGNIY